MQIHDEHLSAYIDDRLEATEKAALEERLAEDVALAAEYRSLQTVKNLLQARKNILRGSVPAEARHLVLVSLEQEWYRTATLERITQESKREESGIIDEKALDGKTKNLSPSRTLAAHRTPNPIALFQKRPYLLAAALAAAILSWVGMRLWTQASSTPKREVTQQKNTLPNTVQNVSSESVFVKESLQNYHAVCSGQITLQYKTNSFDKLDKFFYQHGITYNIVHPKIKAELLGGVVSEENGKKSAHLVFKHNDTLLYMWEIDLDDKTTEHASFHSDIWALLRKGEWIWNTTTSDSTTIVVWEDEKKGKKTLCSVVSALPRTNLQPLFQ